MEIKVGDRYRGLINGKIFTIKNINFKDGIVHYLCDNNEYSYGLEAFKRCQLEKIK